MPRNGEVQTVAVLAAMPAEMRPLVRHLDLRAVRIGPSRCFQGEVDASPGTRVLGALTGIGTVAAGAVAARILTSRVVDRLVVIGIAGGVGPNMRIGDLVVPEIVVDRASGAQFRPRPLPGIEPSGMLLTTDTLVVDPAELSRLASRGTTALDMETAAVAAACESAGCPWSVIRAVSDRAALDGVDSGILDLAGADGSADLGAVAGYVALRPWRIPRLVRLASGMHMGVRVAVRTFLEVLPRLAASDTGDEA